MPLVEAHHRPKDRRVALVIKVFCTNVLASIGQNFFVDKYRTKQTHLSIETLRWYFAFWLG